MARQDPLEILENIKKLPVPPAAVLVVALEQIRTQRLVTKFVENFKSRGVSDDAIARYDCRDMKDSDIARITDELLVQSLFSKSRLIILNHVDSFNAAQGRELLSIAAHCPVGSTILMTASKFPQNSAFAKHFRTANCLIELEELKGQDIRRWAKKEFKSHGVNSVDEQTLTFLIEASESSLDSLNSLIEHLALFSDDDQVTIEQARQLFAHQIDPGEYAFVDTILEGRSAQAEQMLRQLFNAGKNPFLLLSLFSRTFSNLFLIRNLLEARMQPTEIREKLAQPPWLFNKNLAAAKRFSAQKLRLIIHDIVTADSKLKNRSLGPDAIFSELIHHIAT